MSIISFGVITMNERLKIARKALGLNQTEFAARIGVTNPAISKIEKGQNKLTDQMIIIICRTYKINEAWLRTGEGEMFVDETDMIDNLINHLMGDESKTARAVFKALARMGGKEWEAFSKFIREVAKELDS